MEVLELIEKENASIKSTGLIVEETTDYSIFKIIKGNRQINPNVVKRITDSMRVTPLFSPIMVNENFEIIDGQHRFVARKSLDLPIQFIQVPGYGVKEIHTLNTNGSNWKKVDYLRGYVDMGLRPYIMLNQFREMFPEFGIEVCISLSGTARYSAKGTASIKTFENGEFIFKDYENAVKVGKMLMDFKPYYNGFNRRVFVTAFISIAKNKNYNHDEMLTRLNRIPNQITDQTNTDKVKLQFEDIYNYHRKSKISLRY